MKDTAILAAIIAVVGGGIFTLGNTFFQHWLEKKPTDEAVKKPTEVASPTVLPAAASPDLTVSKPNDAPKTQPVLSQRPPQQTPEKRSIPSVEKKPEPEKSPVETLIDPSASGPIALAYLGTETSLEVVLNTFIKSQTSVVHPISASKTTAATRLSTLSSAKNALGGRFNCLFLAKPNFSTTGQPPLFTASGSVGIQVFDLRKNEINHFFLFGLSAAGGSAEKALKNLEPVLRHALETKKIDLRQCTN